MSQAALLRYSSDPFHSNRSHRIRLTILSLTAAVTAALFATNLVSADEPSPARDLTNATPADALALADDRDQRGREPARLPDPNNQNDRRGDADLRSSSPGRDAGRGHEDAGQRPGPSDRGRDIPAPQTRGMEDRRRDFQPPRDGRAGFAPQQSGPNRSRGGFVPPRSRGGFTPPHRNGDDRGRSNFRPPFPGPSRDRGHMGPPTGGRS
jgi:hypothetical protein